MNKIPILLYHRIAAEPPERDPGRMCVSPGQFEQQMSWLKQRGYQTISTTALLNHLEDGAAVPVEKPVVVTFDDGFEDLYTTAWPILDQYEFTATIYLVANLAGQMSNWEGGDGKSAARLMTWEQAREMQTAGYTFGNHTCTHPDLAQLDMAAAQHEIQDAKHILEDKLGQEMAEFAYPYSSFTDNTLEIVRTSGHRAAFSVGRGNDDLFSLWRIVCWRDEPLFHFKRKTEGWQHRIYALRQNPQFRNTTAPLRKLVRRFK